MAERTREARVQRVSGWTLTWVAVGDRATSRLLTYTAGTSKNIQYKTVNR